MAFVTPTLLPVLQFRNAPLTCWGSKKTLLAQNRICFLPKVPGTTSTEEHSKSVRLQMTNASPIPDSFEAACEEAKNAMTAALSSGERRLFVELDTTNGDATYTQLKTTTPTVIALAGAFAGQPIQLVFPDAGAAALARRNWEDMPDTVTVVGLEQYEPRDNDAVIMIVVPRASEVDKLASIMTGAGDTPVVIVNPDLIDMGVTGLSLNARRLREQVIDLFMTVYYLRVFPWGVLFRNFPDKWMVWVDDANESSGFRCLAALDEKPSNDRLDDLFQADLNDSDDGSLQKPGPLEKAMRGFQRFLKVYTKG